MVARPSSEGRFGRGNGGGRHGRHCRPPPPLPPRSSKKATWTFSDDVWSKPAVAAALANKTAPPSNWTKPVERAVLNKTAAAQNAVALLKANATKNVTLAIVKPSINASALLAALDYYNLTSVAAVRGAKGKWWIKNGTAPSVPVTYKTVFNKTVALP